MMDLDAAEQSKLRRAQKEAQMASWRNQIQQKKARDAAFKRSEDSLKRNSGMRFDGEDRFAPERKRSVIGLTCIRLWVIPLISKGWGGGIDVEQTLREREGEDIYESQGRMIALRLFTHTCACACTGAGEENVYTHANVQPQHIYAYNTRMQDAGTPESTLVSATAC